MANFFSSMSIKYKYKLTNREVLINQSFCDYLIDAKLMSNTLFTNFSTELKKQNRSILAIQIFLPRQENTDIRHFSICVGKLAVCTGKKNKTPTQTRFFSIFASKMIIYVGKKLTCLIKIIFLYYFFLSYNKLQ